MVSICDLGKQSTLIEILENILSVIDGFSIYKTSCLTVHPLKKVCGNTILFFKKLDDSFFEPTRFMIKWRNWIKPRLLFHCSLS